ncbi:MAG: hypothetical protein O3C45_00975 [Bacteroidetes bacterium]|nr:hypothetical protein [Bacteroidota bacterium]
MLSFDQPLAIFVVIALAAWGGMYVFRLVRLGIRGRRDAADEEIKERTQRMLEQYRRSKGKRGD